MAQIKQTISYNRTMLDKLRSMAVFTAVAECGSFRQAAKRLALSPSVVSHHISQLENELDIQLLYRSTRSVVLTSDGKRFYESCQLMVESAENALSSVTKEKPSGNFKILAPTPFSVGPFMHDIARFIRSYPEIILSVEFDDTQKDLIQNGIDVAITFQQPANSSLICRTLFSEYFCLFASPEYLAHHGPIETIEQLKNADWIGIPNRKEFTLKHVSKKNVSVETKNRISVNSVTALHQLALDGMGIVSMPIMAIHEDLKKGNLVKVLPEWITEANSCYLVYPARAREKSFTRCFIDFLEESVTAFNPEKRQQPTSHT